MPTDTETAPVITIHPERDVILIGRPPEEIGRMTECEVCHKPLMVCPGPICSCGNLGLAYLVLCPACWSRGWPGIDECQVRKHSITHISKTARYTTPDPFLFVQPPFRQQ